MGLLLLLAQLATGAPAGACTAATPACTERVHVGGGPGRPLIYRTHSLDKKNDRIRTALIMVAVAIVSECGHNDRCVYTTTEVLPVIFPKK